MPLNILNFERFLILFFERKKKVKTKSVDKFFCGNKKSKIISGNENKKFGYLYGLKTYLIFVCLMMFRNNLLY